MLFLQLGRLVDSFNFQRRLELLPACGRRRRRELNALELQSSVLFASALQPPEILERHHLGCPPDILKVDGLGVAPRAPCAKDKTES